MLRLLILAFFLFPLLLLAQKSPTYISLEGGGTGIIGSVNFAKPFIIHPSYKLIFQWGIGWSPEKAQSNVPINIPAQITCSFGKERYFFEAGLGSTFVLGSKLDKTENEPVSNEIYLSPIVGFRHESRNWFGRIYGCPLFHITGEKTYDDVTKNALNIGVGIGVIF